MGLNSLNYKGILKPVTTIFPTENEALLIDAKAYKVAIEKLALIQSTEQFSNQGPIHASIVLGNILKTAKHHVNIYAGSFSGEVSDTDYYLDNLESFLKKGIKLSVIFQDSPNKESLALALIRRYDNRDTTIKVLDRDRDLFKYHFTTADGQMYRLETSGTFEANCCFNDKEATSKLDNIYKHLIDYSSPLPA